MKKDQQSVIVVETLGSVERGVGLRIPTHMTIAPWFIMEKEAIADLGVRLRDMGDSAIRSALGINRDMFGLAKDRPVTIMMVDKDGVDFQRQVASLVRRSGAIVDVSNHEWMHNWNPHISDTFDRAIGIGEKVQFGSLALFSKRRNSDQTAEMVYDLTPQKVYEQR